MFVTLDSDISVEAARGWPDPVLRESLAAVEVARAGLHALQSVLLAELVGRGRVPETVFASLVAVREVTRRTKTAVALHDGSLPGAFAALAAGTVAFEHVAALADARDDLPSGAAANLLADATVLPPDKFARALPRRRRSSPMWEGRGRRRRVGGGSPSIATTRTARSP